MVALLLIPAILSQNSAMLDKASQASCLNLHFCSQDLQYCSQMDNISTQFSPHLQSWQFFSLCLQQTLSMTYQDLLSNTMQSYCLSIQQLMLQVISPMHNTFFAMFTQYNVGSVLWRLFSTSGDNISTVGG